MVRSLTLCLVNDRYLGNEMLALGNEGYDAQFAYEEAIGFMLSPSVRDKDGVKLSFAE